MKVVFIGAIALGTLASFGAEIKEKDGYSGDASGASSFVNGTGWADGKAPIAGNTYVWSKGNLRTPDKHDKKTYKFAGDALTFTAGTLTQKAYGDALTVVDNLTFSGDKTAWSQSGSGGGILARVEGQFTLNCNAFTISSSYDKYKEGVPVDHKDFLFLGSFQSGSGKTPVVSVTHLKYVKDDLTTSDDPYRAEFDVRLAGDNSGFSGKWIVQNVEPSSGYPRLQTRGAVLIAESATALGGDPGTAMPDAVRLFNHGGFAVAPELCADAPFAPDNRGLTIGSTSGDKVGRLVTISNETWSLGMPIAGGSDAQLIKCGAGTVRLCGTYAAGPITVEEGTLVWASPSELPAIAVEAGAGLWISASGTRNVSGQTVCGIESVLANQTCGKIVLDATCSLGNGPIGFAFTVAPAATDYTKYEVLNVPVSVRALVPADFYDETPGTAKRWFSVEVVGDMQKVFVVQYPQVKLNTYAKDNNGPHGTQWYMSDAGVWENNAAPSPSSDYVVDFQVKNTLRTSAGSKETYVFPGHSLTLENNRFIADKNAVLVISNLVLNAGSYVNAAGASGGIVDQWLQGTLIVSPDCTFSSPATIRGTSDHQLSLACDISGSGVLGFRPYETNTTQTTTLTGDNSRFAGNIYAFSQYVTDATPDNGQTLIFTKPECLGGARPVFDYQAVNIARGCKLVAAGSMTLEAENCGFYFGRDTYFSVLEGVVTVKNPIRKSLTLTKGGAGILELAGPVSFGVSGASTADQDRVFVIEEGGLGVATPEAFGEFVMTFTKDAFLAVNAEAENADVRTYGAKSERTDAIAIPDGVLNVRIRASDALLDAHTDFSVPICTVAPAVADAIDGKIAVARVRKHKVTVRRETVGSLVRFVADVTPKGLGLILR